MPIKRESQPLTKQQAIFKDGMLVMIEGMPFMSKGMKGKNLVLRPISEANADKLKKRMVRVLGGGDVKQISERGGEIQDNEERVEQSEDKG